MNRRNNSSFVLGSVMAMFLAGQGVAWADWDRDNDGDWNKGGYGWNGHYEGYRGYYAPHYAPYYRHYYPHYYPHYYYPYYPTCGACTQHSHHHDNHDHWW